GGYFYDPDPRPPTRPLGLEPIRMDGEESNPAPGRPRNTSPFPWGGTLPWEFLLLESVFY
ncbi:hypothetical protein AVEN_215289-1, partial [Araneus ventricosus]